MHVHLNVPELPQHVSEVHVALPSTDGNKVRSQTTTSEVNFRLISDFDIDDPTLGLYLHLMFNPLLYNGLMWFECYERVVYVMFHSTADNSLFPEAFPRHMCHGTPIIDYNVRKQHSYPTEELFEFHRYFHVGPKQLMKNLALEALDSHVNEIKKRPSAVIDKLDSTKLSHA